jgi:type II secretory pathway pseudopilin PulG
LIIGSVAGGLAIVAAIVGFLWYRRRQNNKLNEVKEQVRLQKMVIDAERSNKPAVSDNNSHRNDGDGGTGRAFTRNNGGGGHSSGNSDNNGGHRSSNNGNYTNGNSGGNDNISTSVTYPTPPVYSPNSKSSYNDTKPLLSPKLPYNAEFSPAPGSPVVTYPVSVSSPVMTASPATTYSPANSNNYYNYSDINYHSNSNTINSYNSPHGPQSTLSKVSGPQAVTVIGGPQGYHSPSPRAPQMFGDGRGGTDAYYHEQESFGRRRQNHPQEGNQFY